MIRRGGDQRGRCRNYGLEPELWGVGFAIKYLVEILILDYHLRSHEFCSGAA